MTFVPWITLYDLCVHSHHFLPGQTVIKSCFPNMQQRTPIMQDLCQHFQCARTELNRVSNRGPKQSFSSFSNFNMPNNYLHVDGVSVYGIVPLYALSAWSLINV